MTFPRDRSRGGRDDEIAGIDEWNRAVADVVVRCRARDRAIRDVNRRRPERSVDQDARATH